MDTTKPIPIVIAGGGLVGALTALLIARARPDWQVTVLEPRAEGPAQDKRTIALAAGTVNTLRELEVWQPLAAQACAIKHIHVSDRGYSGMTRLHAEQQGVAALGQVIAAATLNQQLYQACLAQANIDWRGGYRCTGVELGATANTLTCEHQQQQLQLHTQLLLVADGQRSSIRDALGIPVQQTQYDQHGIIATLQLADSLQGWAYERFTETGPIALLPMPNNESSLVWTLTPAEAERVMNLSDAEFVRAAQQAFGYRAGRFTGVSMRVKYPLQLQLAERNIAQRALLIGNASHTLHPIAGQGFNLGVRDALTVSAMVSDQSDPGAYSVLSDYWQARQQDYQRTIGLTDMLVRGFSNHFWPLSSIRNVALSALDHVGPLKQQFAEQTMGLKPIAKPQPKVGKV